MVFVLVAPPWNSAGKGALMVGPTLSDPPTIVAGGQSLFLPKNVSTEPPRPSPAEKPKVPNGPARSSSFLPLLACSCTFALPVGPVLPPPPAVSSYPTSP